MLGTWVMYVRTPGIVRMIGAAGLDFVFIDMQHSSFDASTVADMCEMGRASGVTPIVRPSLVSEATVGRILDWGAVGIMFSDVRSAEEVSRYAKWMQHPPRGIRSVTIGGPSTDYRVSSDAESLAATDRRALLVPQIESAEGIEAVDGIASHPAVDLIEVGRNDLAASLGVPGELHHDRVRSAIEKVTAACRREGVAVGVNAQDAADARELVQAGVTCISYGTDKGILRGRYTAMARELFT